MKNLRFLLLGLYILSVFAVYLFFHEHLMLSVSDAVMYSAVVVVGIIIMDSILHYVRSVVFFSSVFFLIMFLFIGFGVTSLMKDVFFNEALRIGFFLFCAYSGTVVGWKNAWLFTSLERFVESKDTEKVESSPKIVDTSALIDGRIADLVAANMLEGQLIITSGVLAELQHIADAKDHLRRQKGKRGLEVLKKLQSKDMLLKVVQTPPTTNPVDSQLLELAGRLSGAIVTTDHNLASVAKIRHIKTINLNDLSLAMRQPFLPGEELVVTVNKEGKEQGQGVSYLSDGTMVVVENGKQYMGKEIRTEITSILQSDTGRIIFVAVKAS